MPQGRVLAYLDNNVVVGIANNQTSIDLQLFKNKQVRFVLSPSHWVEAARARALSTALQTAKAMEALGPLWIRERRSLQRREVSAWLDGKPNNKEAVDAICHSTSLVANDLTGLHGAIALITCSKIVEHLHNDGSFRNTMLGAYKSNADSFAANVKHVASGKLTTEKEKEIWSTWISNIAMEVGTRVSAQQAATVSRACFPATLAEFEIAKENWARAAQNPKMRLTPQRLADVFHLVVALPYVDFVVSNDKAFRSFADMIRDRLPFKSAAALESLSDLAKNL